MTKGIALWSTSNSTAKHLWFSYNVFTLFGKIVQKAMYFRQFTLIFLRQHIHIFPLTRAWFIDIKAFMRLRGYNEIG